MKKILVLSALVLMAANLFFTSCGEAPKTASINLDSLPADLKIIYGKIEKDPKNADLYCERAEYYFGKRKMDSAVNDMKRAIHYKSNEPKFHIRLSDYYFAMNQTRGTRDELNTAIKLDPKNNEAMLKLGELYYLVKNYDSAVFYINRSIVTEPENARAYFEKGMALKEIGDSAKAAQSFQTAVEKDPKYYDAFMQLGALYASTNDPLCVDYYNNALKLNPKSTEAMYGLGLFFQNNKETEKARAIYNDLIKMDPTNEYAVYNLGYIALVLENKPKDAQPFFDKAAKMAPDYADAVYMRGLCFEKMGDKKNAAADYNAALIIEPEHQLSVAGLKRLAKK